MLRPIKPEGHLIVQDTGVANLLPETPKMLPSAQVPFQCSSQNVRPRLSRFEHPQAFESPAQVLRAVPWADLSHHADSCFWKLPATGPDPAVTWWETQTPANKIEIAKAKKSGEEGFNQLRALFYVELESKRPDPLFFQYLAERVDALNQNDQDNDQDNQDGQNDINVDLRRRVECLKGNCMLRKFVRSDFATPNTVFDSIVGNFEGRPLQLARAYAEMAAANRLPVVAGAAVQLFAEHSAKLPQTHDAYLKLVVAFSRATTDFIFMHKAAMSKADRVKPYIFGLPMSGKASPGIFMSTAALAEWIEQQLLGPVEYHLNQFPGQEIACSELRELQTQGNWLKTFGKRPVLTSFLLETFGVNADLAVEFATDFNAN